MIEGRSGGSGRGTRRELWAPPDSGSAQPTDRRFVSCTDSRPEPFPAPPSHFLPSAASSPVAPACWPWEKFCRTPVHVPLGTRLRRMAGPKGKGSKEGAGDLGGALEEYCGPHLTAVLLTDGSQVCIMYRLSTRVVPCAALAFPSLRRFLTVTCLRHREKSPKRTFRSALVSAGWRVSWLNPSLQVTVYVAHSKESRSASPRPPIDTRFSPLVCSLPDQAARFLRRGLRLFTFVRTLCTAGPRLSTTVSAVRSITLPSAAESGRPISKLVGKLGFAGPTLASF